MVKIVAVDRSDIINPELFEQGSSGPKVAGKFLGFAGPVIDEFGQMAAELLRRFAHRAVGAARDEPRKIGGQGADRRRDRHIIVVKHDDEARMHGARIVHRLVGHAGGHRAIPDYGDDVGLLGRQRVSHGHSESGGDRRRGMRGAKRIVFTLGAFGEPRQAAAPPQGPDTVAPAGENLMRIGLVANVPNQTVARCIENIMKGYRKLDHAKPGTEMAARHRDRIDRLDTQFGCDLGEIGLLQPPQIGGRRDRVEKRSL